MSGARRSERNGYGFVPIRMTRRDERRPRLYLRSRQPSGIEHTSPKEAIHRGDKECPPSFSKIAIKKAKFLWRRPAPDDQKRLCANLLQAPYQMTKGNRMVSRHLPHEYFFLSGSRSEGPIIGHINGRPIPARVVDIRGSRYRFIGVARRDLRGRLDVSALRKNEWLVAPDLIYAAVA
jgi:hypothetical protein